MLNEKRKNGLKIIVILLLMSVSIIMLGTSFGWVTQNQQTTTPNYFNVSDVTFGLTDSVESIALNDVIPTLDKFGLENTAFSFTISNETDEEQEYVVSLVDGLTPSTISNNDIRYELTLNDQVVGVFNMTGSGVIDAGTLAVDGVNNYSIKVWLSYESEHANGVWNKVVNVSAGQVNIDTSGANVPSLESNMIPVYFDENDGVWRKADENNTNNVYRWYDYDSQVWANAVTVSSSTRLFYQKANVGTIVNMDDINTMWVWVPRYKYTIFNKNGDTGTVQEIEIIFEQGLRKTGTVSCYDVLGGTSSQKCFDEINSDVTNGVSTYTHPAFTWNGEELPGLWVAKFEASPDPDSTCYTNVTVANCNVGSLNIYLKPALKSLAGISLANLQTNFRSMELKGNIYGFTQEGSILNSDGSIEDDSNIIDIHNIKNSEWGAVAYLSNSKYGKYGNDDYGEGADKEIYKNNSANTGSSMGHHTTSQGTFNYDAPILGTGASTTGNVYGIYDMHGGKGEYVMVNLQTTLGAFVPGSYTGFTSPYPLSIYYDTYYSNNNILTTKLGDAVKETRWYADSQSITITAVMKRGDNGIFNYSPYNGNSHTSYGSRPVLKVSSNIYITEW